MGERKKVAHRILSLEDLKKIICQCFRACVRCLTTGMHAKLHQVFSAIYKWHTMENAL